MCYSKAIYKDCFIFFHKPYCADLIPNFVEIVKAYASHEQTVLTGVIQVRAKATQITINDDILNNPQIM